MQMKISTIFILRNNTLWTKQNSIKILYICLLYTSDAADD